MVMILGAISGMNERQGNRSTGRKPAPAPFCQPQIPHDLTRARTRAAAAGSWRLSACPTARPAPPLIVGIPLLGRIMYPCSLPGHVDPDPRANGFLPVHTRDSPPRHSCGILHLQRLVPLATAAGSCTSSRMNGCLPPALCLITLVLHL
jgi:hypothetical protein